MDLRELQHRNQTSLFRTGTEVLLAMTEELGEVAQEVALLEKIGSKQFWAKGPSTERLGEELTHLLNLLTALANHYQIDLVSLYDRNPASSDQEETGDHS